MQLEEYLAVPYILVMESVEGPDGEWLRRAQYPELPGCVAEAFTPTEALDKLEVARVQYIEDCLARGESIPVPRPPLRHLLPPVAPDPDRLGFARYLVDTGRIS